MKAALAMLLIIILDICVTAVRYSEPSCELLARSRNCGTTIKLYLFVVICPTSSANATFSACTHDVSAFTFHLRMARKP